MAEWIYDLVQRHVGNKVQLLKLTDLPDCFISQQMYTESGQDQGIAEIQRKYMIPADKFWFVFPEYNGGVPGILKLFLDAVSVRDIRGTFRGKRACLTGISTGRAGNLRGMDHLSSILNYLQVVVHPNRLPISSISKLQNEDGELDDLSTKHVLTLQMEEFLAF